MNIELWALQGFLALAMPGAVATHLRRHESIAPPAVLGVLCILLAVGRWSELSGH